MEAIFAGIARGEPAFPLLCKVWAGLSLAWTETNLKIYPDFG